MCLAWIFFRAESVSAAAGLLSGLGQIHWQPEYLIAFKFLALFTVPLFIVDLCLEYGEEEYLLQHSAPMTRVAVALSTLALITFVSANQANAFIYFQF